MVIAKISLNDHPRETFSYCIRKPGARIIGGNVVLAVNRDKMNDNEIDQLIDDVTMFYSISLNQNSRVLRPVYHLVLCLPPGEVLSDRQFSDLGDRYLAGLICSSQDRSVLLTPESFAQSVDAFIQDRDGLSAYQYTQVLHTDRPHLHVHQIVSRPNLIDGRAISTAFDYYRSQSVLRYLEAEFGLQRVPSSWEWEPFDPEESTGTTGTDTTDAATDLQQAINAALEHSPVLTEFIQHLHQQGVSVQKRKKQLIFTIADVTYTENLAELQDQGLIILAKDKKQHQSQL